MPVTTPETAVLLMAYGSPNSLAEVEPYYQSIRGGRAPTPEEVRDLTERYRKVGGRTGLLEITQEIAAGLERHLDEKGSPQYRVYVGMKHWHPFISDTVRKIAGDGVERLVALPLAPHSSKMSTGAYRDSVEEAVASLPSPMPVRHIESWHANPLYIEALVEKIRDAMKGISSPETSNMEVVFSAHSLPRRILQWDDPYPRELQQCSQAVAEAAGLASWRFAYQSASHTGEPWLGPDILETLADLASQGREHVLVVPIGFVSDNLEILFDIDVEAQELARGLGFNLRRIEMLNASPTFIEALADLVVNGTGARFTDTAA